MTNHQMQQRQTTAMTRGVPEEIIIELESLQVECFAIQQLDQGPRKFFKTAEAMQQLIQIFSNPNVLDSFMMMQGSPLGFLTDQDFKGGYPENIVRDALIQAFLVGIFPVNNQMNIIGRKMYIPKEGFEYLLHHSPHDAIQALEYFRFDHTEFMKYAPEINAATIRCTLAWKTSGSEEENFTRDVQVIYHGIEKKNNIDMAFGKAEAKMLQWLYKKLTNITVPQGDAQEINSPDSEAIDTTGKTLPANASDEQIAKIKELLEEVHPEVKVSMTARIVEKDWKLTADEANSIIGPLTTKARQYQKTLQNFSKAPSKEKPEDKAEEPSPENETKDRSTLNKEMHKLGREKFGEQWPVERKQLINRVNPDKTSSNDLDVIELRCIVKLLKEWKAEQ